MNVHGTQSTRIGRRRGPDSRLTMRDWAVPGRFVHSWLGSRGAGTLSPPHRRQSEPEEKSVSHRATRCTRSEVRLRGQGCLRRAPAHWPARFVVRGSRTTTRVAGPLRFLRFLLFHSYPSNSNNNGAGQGDQTTRPPRESASLPSVPSVGFFFGRTASRSERPSETQDLPPRERAPSPPRPSVSPTRRDVASHDYESSNDGPPPPSDPSRQTMSFGCPVASSTDRHNAPSGSIVLRPWRIRIGT